MKYRFGFILFFFCFFALFCSAQSDSCKIIITTPGYTNIYRYTLDEFSAQMASDFKKEGVTVSLQPEGDSCSLLTLNISRREYMFRITRTAPVARLIYDRNKRQFKGAGFNYIERKEYKYQAPSFEGLSLAKFATEWQPQIEKLIQDRTLLSQDRPNVFIIEADIDEEGRVRKIVELSGALKQYAQVFIDKIYDISLKGWQPATRNGVPYRTLAQIYFELPPR
ncbi:MAG TPA: hypothetical protein IAA13_00395 [Candidatus Alistipes merdigallinarum]|nr:hypothetical protein [Candidatus Alistipes merdigallinarum]